MGSPEETTLLPALVVVALGAMLLLVLVTPRRFPGVSKSLIAGILAVMASLLIRKRYPTPPQGNQAIVVISGNANYSYLYRQHFENHTVNDDGFLRWRLYLLLR